MSKKNKKTEEEIKQEKEIETYQKPSFFSRIPYGVKAELIKYWFYGALFFFIGMGLSAQGEMLALLGGLIGGVVFDFMYGNILLIIETEKGQHDDYIIYKSKKLYSLIFNILFELAVFLATAYICIGIVKLYGKNNIWLFQEPLSQALVALVVDGILLLIKYLIKKIVIKCKENKEKKL